MNSIGASLLHSRRGRAGGDACRADKVRALELGADDYVTKLFGLQELVARLRAVMRRAEPGSAADVYERKDLRIDFTRLEATRAGRPISLTPTELRILRRLARRPGQVVTIEALQDQVWGKAYLTDRVVYTHINNIRKKIETRPHKPRVLVGIRGVGYRFEG